MARIIVHIGDRKTGTTSLQSVLDRWDRSGEALKHGVLYPRAGRWPDKNINHVNLAHEILGDDRFLPESGGWSDLAVEVAKSETPLIILSSEGFESADPNALRFALDKHLPGHDIEILCYLRPHMERIRASYAQNTKTGKYHKSLESFARKSARGRLGTPGKRLLAWRKVFGDAFRLRLYQRNVLLNGDILQDFLVGEAKLSSELVADMPRPNLENPTPGAAVVEIIRALSHGLPIDKLPNDAGRRGFMTTLEQSVLRKMRDEFGDLYPQDTQISF